MQISIEEAREILARYLKAHPVNPIRLPDMVQHMYNMGFKDGEEAKK